MVTQVIPARDAGISSKEVTGCLTGSHTALRDWIFQWKMPRRLTAAARFRKLQLKRNG